MDNERQKQGRSIFVTQVASFLFVILIIATTFGFQYFSVAKSHLEREVGRKLQDIAKIAAGNAPFERLELIKAGDDQTRMVLRLKEKLDEIRNATGVSNINIFSPDMAVLLDLRPDISIGHKLGIDQFDSSFFKVLKEGASTATSSYKTAGGELFISAYAPVVDSDGVLFAIVGVDAGTKEVQVIEQLQSRLYFIAGMGVILAFVLSLLLARKLTRPISEMAHIADRLGKGEYKARATIPSTTELSTLAGAINEMAAQVQKRDTQLKELSAGVAHEIRNPLNSIKLLITLLEEELREKEISQPETISTLHYEIGKLNRFLTEFLTYSRPITLALDKANPADIANRAVDMALSEAEERRVTIQVAVDSNLPDIPVDRDRLEQSLLNIILNAVQACQEGGEVKVRVHRSEKGSMADFVVADDGIGIDEETMNELFQPFFTTKESGTGLGLSNARRIVQEHQGTIDVHNNPEKGARITISIPVSKEG